MWLNFNFAADFGKKRNEKINMNNIIYDTDNQAVSPSIREVSNEVFASDYASEINPGKYFIYKFGELYYCRHFHIDLNVELFVNEIIKQYKLTQHNFLQKNESSKLDKPEKLDYASSDYFIYLREKLLITASSDSIMIYYGANIDCQEIDKIIKIAVNSKIRKKLTRKFYMAGASQHSEFGFELQKFEVKKQKTNIEENYNNDFPEVHNIINTFLSRDNANGLVLLHGKYGTGKTTYIRHLISSINRRFIFLPINMMENISSPNFLPFISQYKNSILILEDCEELLMPRELTGSAHTSLANLLNLGDGLLSDALNIKIICTFNADVQQIDKAILRKGRLIARYEFKELDVEKVNLLFEKNKIAHTTKHPMTLADIYNFTDKDFSKQKNKKTVGFSME